MARVVACVGAGAGPITRISWRMNTSPCIMGKRTSSVHGHRAHACRACRVTLAMESLVGNW